MNREIAELIKTLNGGLKHLPGLAQQMVHQYVVGHAVLSAVELILSALLFIGAFYFGKRYLAMVQQKHSNQVKLKYAKDKLMDSDPSDIDLDVKSFNNILNQAGHNEDVNEREDEQKNKQLDYVDKERAYYEIAANQISDDMLIVLFVLFIVTGLFGFLLFTFGSSDLYRALTPIWSIISSLKG